MVRRTRHESDNQVLIPNLEHSKAIIRLQCTLSSCKRFLVLLHRCPLPSNIQEISATVATYSQFTTMSVSRTSFYTLRSQLNAFLLWSLERSNTTSFSCPSPMPSSDSRCALACDKVIPLDPEYSKQSL
jgi:hypothetical protein